MEKIQNFLDVIFKISFQTQSQFVNKYQNEVERFVFCGIEKLNKISLTFLRLYPQIKDSKEIEFSLGILARSVLMDMILVLEIKNVYNHNKDEGLNILRQKVKECCYKLINDGTNHFIEEIFSSGTLGDDEKKEKAAIFTSLFSNAFDASGVKPKLKKEFKFHLAGIVAGTKNDLAFAKPIYNLYSYYSKYDHLSHWTSLSSHFPFEEKKGRLDLSIIFMTAHLRDLLSLAIDYDDNYKNLQMHVDELQNLLNDNYIEDELEEIK